MTCAQHGESALHWAARGGHLEIVTFLQDNGADINAKNQVGYSLASYKKKNKLNFTLVQNSESITLRIIFDIVSGWGSASARDYTTRSRGCP
jgi:hypothetical protein